MRASLLAPRNLQTASKIDHARELLGVLLTTTDPEDLADAMEAAVQDSELAHALMFQLLCRARGWDETRTGVEVVAGTYEPDARDLWLP